MPPQNQNKPSLKDTLTDETIKNVTQKMQPARRDQAPVISRIKDAVLNDTKMRSAPTVPTETKKDSLVKPIQTYQSDVAEAVRSKNESVTSISLAEKARADERGITTTKTKEPTPKIFIAILIILLLGGGAFAIYATVLKKNQVDTPVVIPEPESIVSTSKNSTLSVVGLQTSQLFNEIKGESERLGLSVGSLGNIKLLNGETLDLSPQEFFALTGWNTPNTLERSVKDYMIGVFGKELGTENFIVLETESFELAFSGMLSWEKTLSQDMKNLFGDTQGSFRDGFIKNRDVRAIRTNDGVITLLYAFLNPNTVVITQSSEAFMAVLNQFTTNQLVR